VKNLFDLSGKVALVTGGARGIGKAISDSLTGHGATTVICDIANLSGQTHTAIECDVRDKSQVEACVAQVVQRYRRIDVLVNKAGIHRRVDPLDASQQDIDDVFSVNLLGNFHMASAVAQ